MTVEQLSTSEYNPFYETYINNIPKETSLGILLLDNLKKVSETLGRLQESQLSYRYEEGKWSVAQVFQHLIDVERIFQFRALSIARKESQSLPGFDHDLYAENSGAQNRAVKDLKQEFEIVRNSSSFLFDSFTEEMLIEVGHMNGAAVTPRAIGFIIVGHTMHHLQILNERYKI